jgi:hypothetical protein
MDTNACILFDFVDPASRLDALNFTFATVKSARSQGPTTTTETLSSAPSTTSQSPPGPTITTVDSITYGLESDIDYEGSLLKTDRTIVTRDASNFR